MKFLVVGGTGLIGSKVVTRLCDQNHEVVVAAPSTGIDIISGQGLDAAMVGTEVVVDLANSPSFEDQAVLEFFQTAGRNLLSAEAKAGVRHHLALSVVGTDKLSSSGYFRGKIAQERLIRESGIAYTIVHSTQFFEFLPGIIKAATDGSSVRLSPALVQPIASDDVADAVARLATQAPANGVVEIAGPEREPLAALAQRFINAVHDPLQVVSDPKALYFGAELKDDTLVPVGQAWHGALNFEEWFQRSDVARARATA